MRTYSKYIPVIIAALLVAFSSCEKDDYTLGDLVAPSNTQFTYEVVGADTANPYGDGSGVVNFSGSADNAITLNYDFGDGKDIEIAPGGEVSHLFSKTGVHSYLVTMTAVGTGGISSTVMDSVTVFSSFTDDEAVEFLTGGASKTWYWAADVGGHVGLGPNFVDGVNHTFAAWYNAVPFEKTCMYDAEFVFTQTEEGVTFEMTSGPAYIPGTYAGKIGVEADACYGDDVATTMFGVKNVSFGPSASIATEDGGYRGTTMSFSDGGFMGWYVGKSDFEIIEITENTLRVRIEEDETFAWYQTLTTTKPVEE